MDEKRTVLKKKRRYTVAAKEAWTANLQKRRCKNYNQSFHISEVPEHSKECQYSQGAKGN